MTSLTLSVSNHTIFDLITIEESVNKLSFKWEKELKEWEKSQAQYNIERFLSYILKKNKNIKILDISQLEGINRIYYPINTLYEIYFPKTIEALYFTNKNNKLRKVYAPGASSIIINKAYNLEHVEIGANVKELSLSETGITNIDLPHAIKLHSGAFKGCKNLKSVVLKRGTDVPPSTFEDCPNLIEVTLPDDLLVIEPFSFKNCINLRCIYGGQSVKQVFPSAFEGCKKLEMMECRDFYKYTNLSISDKLWTDKFRSYKPLSERKTRIKQFIQGLSDNNIEYPEKYIADEFFHDKDYHIGFVVDYQSRIHSWIIWSLSHNRFFATKGDKYKLHQDDVVTFTIDYKPTICIDDILCIQFPMIYIEESSSLKKIERKGEDSDKYKYILEYFMPRVSLIDYYKEIIHKIDSLDIPSIIESYSIKAKTWWQTYPGRDDSQFYERVAKSEYTDEYMNILLPQEKYQNYDNGCRPWGFDEVEENRKMQASADSETKRLKEYAHKNYSRDAHICKLLEEFINKRRELEKDIENKYHIQAIKNFLQCRFVESGEGENSLNELYSYSIVDILKDQKYNERVSWSYKHRWVEDTID